MKSRLRNFFMNSGYVAGVIVICGIVMDIGVNITKFSLVTVTESYMDYIYSAIITIAILSFSIIALIAGMFSNTYYGYKLGEIIQFKESPVNFKKYIFWSFASIAFATILLFAEFNLCCVNTLTMMLFAVIFLERKMAYNIYKIMVDESVCYKLVISHYKTFSQNGEDYNLYKKEIERLFFALKQYIKANDSEGKNNIIELLSELDEKMVVVLGDSNEIYQYFYSQMKECVYDISNNFGYNEMIRDVIKIYSNLPESRYERIDLYVIPLQNMRFWDDQMLVKNNYFDQIKEIDFLEEYEEGLVEDSEIERIFYCFFENIIKNQVCTKIVKETIIENYFWSLTKFYWKDRNDLVLPIDCIGAINIWHYFVLKNENVKERNYIFNVLIKELLYNNRFSRERKFFDVLSLMLQSFYAYAFYEGETLTAEYREELQKTFMQPITNATLKNFKISTLIKVNIEEILVSAGNRISKKSNFERRFEYYPPFMMVKTVVWTQEFNIKFMFMLYVIYHSEIGFYSLYGRFMDWDNLDGKSKLEILSHITHEFDYNSRTLKNEFQEECLQFSVVLEHTYKINDEEQANLFEHLREEQEKLMLNTIEDSGEIEVDSKEIYQSISDLMEKDQIFGWAPEFVSESYIKYTTPVCIGRKEYRTTINTARTLELAIIEAVERYIQRNTNELELTFDMEGIERLLEFICENNFDARNFSYTDDWALAQYRKEQSFKALVDMQQGIEVISTPKISQNMYFNKEHFKFNIKISKIEFENLTLDECAEYIEGSKCYNGFYNIDGVLMPKEKAILSVQKLFCKESYAFKLMVSFQKDDIAHINYEF